MNEEEEKKIKEKVEHLHGKPYEYKPMNEEEKEVIEYLEESLKATIIHKEKLNIIKNLIQKQQEGIEVLNKMKKRYKIALFMIIRNSTVIPRGIALGKTEEEINKMTYDTMCEVLAMIDFKKAGKLYDEVAEKYDTLRKEK